MYRITFARRAFSNIGLATVPIHTPRRASVSFVRLSCHSRRACSSGLHGIVDEHGVVRSPFSDVPIPNTNLCDFLFNNTEKEGRQVLFTHGITKETVTFDQLREQTACLGSALVRRGFDRADVLAIVSPNSLEYAPLLLAPSAVGGVVTTINPTYTENEISYQLKNSRSKFVATTPSLLPLVEKAAKAAMVKNIIVVDDGDQHGFGYISYRQLLRDTGSLFNVVDVDPKEDLAVLPYSSGTTGLAKGVMLTHRNLVANLCQFDHPEHFGFPSRTVVLGVLPFYHIYGMVVTLMSTINKGYHLIVLPKFEPPSFLAAIQNHRVQHGFLVPPIILFLANHPEVNNYDLSSMVGVTSAAAPLGGEIVKRAQSRTGVRNVHQAYGLTETSPVTHSMLISLGMSKPDSIGCLLQNQLAKIVCTETEQALGVGEEGEVVMAGPNVMKGYLYNPEATEKSIDKEGWFHTGDVGYYDSDGHFYITDRLKELIKVKGMQVAPAELEALLHHHPKISDAAVVGLAHERLGEAPKAYVVRKDSSLSKEEVFAYIKSAVAKHKWLEGGVEFVDQIPKSPSGKILRRLLRDSGVNK